MDTVNINKGAKAPLSEVYGKFYSPEKALSYGRSNIFSVGSRSIGKSTGWAIWLLNRYMTTGNGWIYVRRTKDELQETATGWFKNAYDILKFYNYNPPDINYRGGTFYADKNPAGYAIGLSVADKKKSSPLVVGDSAHIIYDEFLPRNGVYLGGQGSMEEVDAIASLFQTVDRRVGKAYNVGTAISYLGNAYSYFNPFFIHYKIDTMLRTDTKYLAPKGKIWIVEQTKETEATKEIQASIGYQMSTESTRLSAYENVLAGNGGEFIKKIQSPMECLFAIEYEHVRYGVFFVPSMGCMYIKRSGSPAPFVISATTEDHRPNYILIQRASYNPATIQLKECFNRGDVYFADGKAQYMLLNYMLYN